MFCRCYNPYGMAARDRGIVGHGVGGFTRDARGRRIRRRTSCAALAWSGEGLSGTWRVRARTRLGCGKMGGRRVAKRGGRGGCEGERRSLFCLALVLVLSVLVPALACRVRFRAWVGHFLKLYL